ncbi:SIS domain-containing protein [Patescibacteria group bacterium]|nr:SIS domain-containing protein [Patescibacteria group bacterium]
MTLNNYKQIQKLGAEEILESIRQLPNQCQQAFEEANKIKIPANYQNINNVVVNGMGGSGLGAHILKSVYKDQIKIPFEIINSYQLPKYVNNKTLYLVASYSGNTEEPLATLNEAKKRGAKIVGFAAGGKLKSYLQKNKLPGYIFEPKFNSSGQPRMGVGYSLVGQLVLLSKLGLVKFSKHDLQKVIKALEQGEKRYDFGIKTTKNAAKQTAQKIKNKIPIIVACEHLAGNAHAVANQINESAKHSSFYYLIPELNHHLLEGLKEPKGSNLVFIFFESKLFLPRNQKRIKITKQILNKYKISHVSFSTVQSQKINQAFEVLQFGSYVSFYMAIQNNVNPEIIPFVDFFKNQLSKK